METVLTEKKTFHITTFGCQMNEHDSEIMAGLLLEKGYEQAKDRSSADIVIFNTCSIRENADKRFFGHSWTAEAQKGRGKGIFHGMRMQAV